MGIYLFKLLNQQFKKDKKIMDKKINLEKIILKAYGCRTIDEFRNENNMSTIMYKEVMLEFGKQLLDLAAENAKIKLARWDNDSDEVDKFSIINTIKQVI
jgi:hypothetical protein